MQTAAVRFVVPCQHMHIPRIHDTLLSLRHRVPSFRPVILKATIYIQYNIVRYDTITRPPACARLAIMPTTHRTTPRHPEPSDTMKTADTPFPRTSPSSPHTHPHTHLEGYIEVACTTGYLPSAPHRPGPPTPNPLAWYSNPSLSIDSMYSTVSWPR